MGGNQISSLNSEERGRGAREVVGGDLEVWRRWSWTGSQRRRRESSSPVWAKHRSLRPSTSATPTSPPYPAPSRRSARTRPFQSASCASADVFGSYTRLRPVPHLAPQLDSPNLPQPILSPANRRLARLRNHGGRPQDYHRALIRTTPRYRPFVSKLCTDISVQVLAIGFLLVILSSALWHNFLPLIVVATYVVAPLPNWICARCANPDDFMESAGNAVIDFGRFLTGFLVLMGIGTFICLPFSSQR